MIWAKIIILQSNCGHREDMKNFVALRSTKAFVGLVHTPGSPLWPLWHRGFTASQLLRLDTAMCITVRVIQTPPGKLLLEQNTDRADAHPQIPLFLPGLGTAMETLSSSSQSHHVLLEESKNQGFACCCFSLWGITRKIFSRFISCIWYSLTHLWKRTMRPNSSPSVVLKMTLWSYPKQ